MAIRKFKRIVMAGDPPLINLPKNRLRQGSTLIGEHLASLTKDNSVPGRMQTATCASLVRRSRAYQFRSRGWLVCHQLSLAAISRCEGCNHTCENSVTRKPLSNRELSRFSTPTQQTNWELKFSAGVRSAVAASRAALLSATAPPVSAMNGLGWYACRAS